MALVHIFSDESGCFTFRRQQGASKYFILCSVAMKNCAIGGELLGLRRSLTHRGLLDRDNFHATTDTTIIREQVFDLIAAHDFRIDSTIFEKSKAQPHTRSDEPTFYKYTSYYHYRYVAPRLVKEGDELAIHAAALTTKRGKAHFKSAINDVAQQVVRDNKWSVSFTEASRDPCLQIADYCAWAIQRKWERGDASWYQKIQGKLKSEFEIWKTGKDHYY